MSAEFDALYARIPSIACKRKCQAACGPVAGSRVEVERITMLYGLRPLGGEDGAQCGYLDVRGLCVAYAQRPLICRLWGVVPEMRCPHGCEPERWLTEVEVLELFREADRIGGVPSTLGW